MKKQIFLFGLMILLSLSFVNADNIQSFGTYKQGSNITLTQNCVNVTYVNITSISINGISPVQIINSSTSMNLISNGYQTYTFINTSYLGAKVQYIVTGICDENGIVKSWSYDFYTTPTGTDFNSIQITIYLFFFILCLVITFFSIKLIKNNPFSKDIVKGKDSYDLKKRNEFLYYVNLIKQKTWIIGIFGVYLSLLLFVSLSGQLLYNLGITDIGSVIFSIVYVMTWGLVPFTLFWFIYIIFVFYNSTKDIIYYQLGAMTEKKR